MNTLVIMGCEVGDLQSVIALSPLTIIHFIGPYLKNPYFLDRGIKNKISDGYPYYLTLTVIDWVDIFTRTVYKHVIIESLRHCQKEKGLLIYCWCLMSNHLHLNASAKKELIYQTHCGILKNSPAKRSLKQWLKFPKADGNGCKIAFGLRSNSEKCLL